MKKFLPAASLGLGLFLAPVAFADPARDALMRAETRISTLNSADAFSAAPANFEEAQLRLREAQLAEGKNRDEETRWRSAEAELQAEIVQEKIKLRGLERTVTEIEAGLVVLRRELNS
jgi:hypothetical protein